MHRKSSEECNGDGKSNGWGSYPPKSSRVRIGVGAEFLKLESEAEAGKEQQKREAIDSDWVTFLILIFVNSVIY